MQHTTCDTISCKAPATHRLSWPGWDGETVHEKVCEPCGEAYLRRPALKAELNPLFTSGMRVRDICPTRHPAERFGVGTIVGVEIEDETTMVPTLHVRWDDSRATDLHGPCDIEPIN